MPKDETNPRSNGFTEFLDKNAPALGIIHHEQLQFDAEKSSQEAQDAAENGDIWTTLNILIRDHSFKETLEIGNAKDEQRRDLLIRAAQQRQASHLNEPTMRYETFMSTVKTAKTMEDILHAMPTEWLGKITRLG
jgi:hypothetical protein